MSWSKSVLFGDDDDYRSNIQNLFCPVCGHREWWQVGNYGGEADDMRDHIKREHPESEVYKYYGEAE